MQTLNLQNSLRISRRSAKDLLALWRRILLESLPPNAVRLIEGRSRPQRVRWAGDTIESSAKPSAKEQTYEVVLDASAGLVVDFDLPQEAEANLEAIVAHQIPLQTPFQADQVSWDVGISARRGRMISVQVVLCPSLIADAVVDAMRARDGQLVSIQLEGADIAHQLLPKAQQRTVSVDQDIRLGRKLLLANAFGLCALIAAVLLGQLETVRTLEERALHLTAQAQAVRDLRAEVFALQEQNSFLAGTQSTSATALQTLEVLADVIHEGAWLDQVVITAETVELGGYADASSEVLQAIDQSTRFANAVYRAPVRAQRGGNIERFSIAAEHHAVAAQESSE